MTAASALVLLTSGVGHAVVSGVEDGMGRVDAFAGVEDRPGAGKGLNILVAGIDDRARFTKAERKKYRLGDSSCDCTDTLMLLHLAEDGKRVSVVSLPRDSLVTFPPHTDRAGKKHKPHRAKINSAFSHGGSQLTVATVEKATGVHVDHYLEVDFAGFLRTVDALGGVEVCTAHPLKDKYSGLDLPAGTSHLDGAESLAYVRARHLDGVGDFGRMQRQRRFLAALVEQATAGGVLMNPAKFEEVSTALLESVRADHGFGTKQLLALGEAMRGLRPGDVEFASVPVKDGAHSVKNLGSTVLWDSGKAERLFAALREDTPLTPPRKPGEERTKDPAMPVDVPPEQVRVQVENGTARAGLGHQVDTALRATGFRTTGIPRNAKGEPRKRTVITYDPRWDRSVRSVAAALPGAKLVEKAKFGPTIRVTVGSDYERVTKVRPADPLPGPGDPDAKGFGAITGDDVACPEP